MYFYKFLTITFTSIVAASFVLKSTILAWSPETFDSLSFSDQLFALAWGLRFDIASSAYLMLAVALSSYIAIRLLNIKRLTWAWVIFPGILLTFVQLGDLIYFDNTGHHVSYEIKELINESSGLLDTAISGYSIPIFTTLLIALVGIAFINRTLVNCQKTSILSLEVPLLLSLFIFALLIRGSIRDKPLSPSHAFYVGSAQMAAIALTPSFSIISSLRPQTKSLEPIYLTGPKPSKEFLEENLTLLLNQKKGLYIPPNKKVNVVLFLLESWPAELMRSYNSGAPITTPELDKLKTKGFSTDGLMANGTRTVVGVFSSLCSYPSPLDSQIPNTKLQFLDYRCLPELMRDAGWQVSMFQGMHDGLTGQLARKLGVTSTFGKLDMPPPNIEPNGWGYQDPDLYDFVLSKAKQETRPFFYIVNNTTTHDTHGKQLPSDEEWKFGKSNKDEMQKSVLYYADKALGSFIKQYEGSKLGPTIFIFSADHTAGNRSGNFGRYWIPFSMYSTDGSITPKHKAGIGSQIDVAPTILDALGGRAPWFAGQSLLAEQATPEGGYFSSGNIGWIKNGVALEYQLSNPKNLRCFNWKNDLTYKHELPCPSESRTIADYSYAFTWYSQEMLFRGQTKKFGQLN
jgi:phosphoglycerol transferase MdoB-like AlkP superfamily enzyme